MNNRRLYSLISLVMLVVTFSLGAYRLFFLARAERTTGVVTKVWAENAGCGRSGQRKCTKFYALVRFQAADAGHSVRVPAGRESGHGRYLSLAEYRAGVSVPVLFDASNPERAIRDGFSDKWGTPLGTLSISVTAYLVSFLHKSKMDEVVDTGEIISLDLNKPPIG